MRVNSDLSSINEYFNVYIPEELKVKLKLYIKKLYGSTELYECDADSLDKFDFSTLTKPLSSCKNKNSIFNRLLTFDKSKILSGYLDVNSYFDIYIDIDEEENKDIKTSIIDMNNDIKNTAKYLIKEVEYNIKLERKYLLKMEEGFDARIFIYDENKTNILILDSSLPFGELEGENLTIKSNNDVMVYFYSELPKKLRQIKIENINGKNVLLKLNPNIEYYLDYGFKGYSFSVKNSFKTKIYPIENLYNKLRVKLLEKESFYYYFDTSEYETDVDYDSLNNPKNDFTFTAIPKNNDENSILVINNMKKKYTRYQVNYCKNSFGNIKMFYFEGENSDFNEKSQFEFSEEINSLDVETNGLNKYIRFISYNDFIISYSFFDDRDKEIKENKQWYEEREELNELTISEITKLENSLTYSLKFKPNYKNSLTRYIFVITEKNEDNTLENFEDPCYVTKLVTEKTDGIKVINKYDIGENEYINVELGLSDFLTLQTEYIVSIISQELRFEKKINFYESKTFEYTLEAEVIDIEKEQELNFDNNKVYFKLTAEKKGTKNEMFLLNYNLEQQESLNVEIIRPDNKKELLSINKKEGFLNFLWDQSGSYNIYFKKSENNYLKATNNGNKGTFKILSTESAFKLDLTKDNVEFEEYKIERDEELSLSFIVESLNKDYPKKISIADTEFGDINQIVSINKNGEGDKFLNLNYYTFEKGSKYIVNIKFIRNEENDCILKKTNIKDFSAEDNIKKISRNITFEDSNDKFIIIAWEKISKDVEISNNNDNAKFYISNSKSNNVVKEFQNLNFTKLENSNIIKRGNSDYSILMVELSNPLTKINFVYENKEKTESKKSSTGLIVLIVLASVIILILIIFFVIRFVKKKQSKNIGKEIQDIKQDKELNEL